MEFDQMLPIVQRAFSLAVQGWDIASAWLLSPAAWSQFTLLVVAYYGAVFATKKMNPIITLILTPQDGSTSVIAQIRLFILMFLPLLAYAFTGIVETLTRSIFRIWRRHRLWETGVFIPRDPQFRAGYVDRLIIEIIGKIGSDPCGCSLCAGSVGYGRSSA